MKKILALLAGIGLFFGGCSKMENSASKEPEDQMITPASRMCMSHEIYESMMRNEPEFRKNQEALEALTDEFIHHPERFALWMAYMKYPSM